LRALREEQTSPKLIAIGGLLGPRNDCYQPEQGLSVEQAHEYHAWQADQLVHGGADYLVAQTLPSVDEALGMAQAMAATGAPYIVSFVINRHGRVLDGSRLLDAVHRIDANTQPCPWAILIQQPSAAGRLADRATNLPDALRLRARTNIGTSRLC
jgi:S-methylmethionine-dependent homocysteine/selenocysteine methylase